MHFSANPKFVLTDPELFGKDAAEDDTDEVFQAYVMDRPESFSFLDSKNYVRIAKALKGEGKSALLRLVRTRLLQQGEPPIIVAVKGKDVSPILDSTNSDLWTREWKKSILSCVAQQIGSQIGMAWTDDAISLVEEAERTGARERNFVSAVFDRLGKSTSIKRSRLPVASIERLVQRWLAREDSVWVFADDIDENFKNTPADRIKVASFFMAVRDLSATIPQLRIRSAIRPNIWELLVQDFEALSKVRQYVEDLRWSEDDIRDLLAARIRGYLRLTRQDDESGKYLPGHNHINNPTYYMALVFEPWVKWGNADRPMHVPLATLSRRRPRWVLELCREAAKLAHSTGKSLIDLSHVNKCLETYGHNRISDTIAEFSSQCPQVGELIQAFSQQNEEYATSELMTLISKRILQALTPVINGRPASTPLEIAHFLYQVDFITAKRNLGDSIYEHHSYADRPHLLRARTNIDDGVRWEISPAFRQALMIRDATGKILRRPPKDKRGR